MTDNLLLLILTFTIAGYLRGTWGRFSTRELRWVRIVWIAVAFVAAWAFDNYIVVAFAGGAFLSLPGPIPTIHLPPGPLDTP